MVAHPNPKREEFCQQYLIDFNGSAAATRAKYSKKNARRIASEILKDPIVQDRVKELVEARAARFQIDQDAVLNAYADIALNGMSKFLRISCDGDPIVDLSQCTPADLDRLAEITTEDFKDGRGDDARDVRKVKIKPLDRMHAIDQIARHLGMFEKDNRRELEAGDALKALFAEIWKRGSKAPVATQEQDQ